MAGSARNVQRALQQLAVFHPDFTILYIFPTVGVVTYRTLRLGVIVWSIILVARDAIGVTNMVEIYIPPCGWCVAFRTLEIVVIGGGIIGMAADAIGVTLVIESNRTPGCWYVAVGALR